MIWQTQPKEPMGQLLDQGKLTRKDLEWAVSKASRPDVRRAARRLLQELDHGVGLTPGSAALAELPTMTLWFPVVLGSGYLEEQHENHLGKLGVALGVLVMVVRYALIDAARAVLASGP